MSRDILIVESTRTKTDRDSTGLHTLVEGLGCRRLDWDTFRPEDLAQHRPCVVLLVANPAAPTTVVKVLEWMRAHPSEIPTLVILPSDPDEALVEIAGQCADEFLIAPANGPELRARLRRLLGRGRELDAVREKLTEETALAELIGQSEVFLRILERIPRVAKSNVPVLIRGETGTGKELCARAIHHLSSRRASPFVAVDCGAIPDHLFENELFGHLRGAYTDAHRDQPGLIATAEGGTLFLDEVDALTLPAQGKLLRFLQERSYRPLGGSRFSHADVNVLAATNRSLQQAVERGQFRPDLFFRLNVVELELPPLRERREDIPLLVSHFLGQAGVGGASGRRWLSRAALTSLVAYDWPGNVRQLYNVVIRSVIEADGDVVMPFHLSIPLASNADAGASTTFRVGRDAAVQRFEKGYVETLLRKHSGNVSRAAREAGKERRAFGRLIKKYGIDRTEGV